VNASTDGQQNIRTGTSRRGVQENHGFADTRSQVLQAINIVELIGRTVGLKRAGKNYVGLCPFHQEKTPSFNVDPNKQYFHCFGCKKSGNAIDFVIERDRVDFKDALRILADEAGIEIKTFAGSKERSGERQALLEAHSAAGVFFEKQLSDPLIGKAARDYLVQRGFNDETVRRFHVGLAPASWDALLKSPLLKKFPPQILALGGLVKAREGGNGYYDTFRNRLIFPIRDENGRVIAFGGRKMPGSEDPAKYLNSPETPLFSKSRSVFGLDLARQKIVETQTVAIVEGYTDVVMAHQFGAANVVSTLGTALTEQHVKVLMRFANRIVLLFDADTAGDVAVNKAVELFLTQPIEIAIASMPDGLDPDEYLLKFGLESFNQLLAGATDALAYKWKQLVRRFRSNENDLTGQQKAVQDYLKIVADARATGPVDPLRWGQALSRVSRLTEIPVDELNRQFKLPKSSRSHKFGSADLRRRRSGNVTEVQVGIANVPTLNHPEDSSAGGDKAETADASAEHAAHDASAEYVSGDTGFPGDFAPRELTARDRAENIILGVLLAEPHRWAVVQQHMGPDDFTTPVRRVVAETYWDYQRNEGEPVFNEFLTLLRGADQRELAAQALEEVEKSAQSDSPRDAARHEAPDAQGNRSRDGSGQTANGQAPDNQALGNQAPGNRPASTSGSPPYAGGPSLDAMLAGALEHLAQERRREEGRKLVARLRRTTGEQPLAPNDAAALLKQLQEKARQPDLRRVGG
jgi:DNA primase catalytic core